MTRLAIIGCGNIAQTYVEQIQAYPGVHIAGFADLAAERAQAFADRHGGTVYPDLDAVLDDPAIDVVVNLTIHHAHADVIRRCLTAGKHVYTEKPLALSADEAAALVALADARGLRLSSAPITFMGEAQQTLMQWVRGGRLGPVRVVYAEINHGRIETWHPNPVPFYDVGILYDVAIYPLTLLTALWGPIREVQAFGAVVQPARTTLDGDPYQVTTPDFTVGILHFQEGPLVRLTANFYVRDARQGSSLAIHGDDGSLYVKDCHAFDAEVSFGAYDETPAPVPLVRSPFAGVEFGRGLHELAEALSAGRPHRAQGAHAAHVVEVIDALHRSIDSRRPVAVASSFTPPEPMPWA